MAEIKSDDFEQEEAKIPEDDLVKPNNLTPEEEKAELADLMSFDSIPTDPVPEPPAEEAPPTPKDSVVEEKEEEKPAAEEKEEEKKEEEEKEEEPPDMASQMAELAALFSKDDKDLTAKLDKPEDKKEEALPKEEKKEEPAKVDNVDTFIESITKGVEYKETEYLKADDFPSSLDEDDVLKLNIAINTAVQNALSISRKQSLRDNLDVMPKVYDRRIQTHITAFKFWEDNPHLKQLTQDHPEWATIIRKKADAIQMSEPNLTQRQILTKTGKEIEAFLKKTGSTGYLKDAKVDSKGGNTTPALPKKPGQVVNRKAPKGVTAPTDADQIMEMIEFSDNYGV